MKCYFRVVGEEDLLSPSVPRVARGQCRPERGGKERLEMVSSFKMELPPFLLVDMLYLPYRDQHISCM